MDNLCFLGKNSIDNLFSIVANYTNILVFCGKKSFTESNIKIILEEQLLSKNITYYSDFANNPKSEDVERAVSQLAGLKFEVIVAIGGGSVIDFAKLFKFCIDTNSDICSYVNKEDYKFTKNTPLIAIPTTAGTGAEATKFAVVYIDGKKFSIEDEHIKPDIAIIDSQFLKNLPRYLKATTALDAYCQALESYWSINANAESIQYSTQSIELCRDYLVDYVNVGSENACEKMSLAAHLAGKAINIAKTTISHALSYSITSNYDIPHGHAVALSIARLMYFNCVADDKMENLLKIMKLTKDGIIEYFDTLFSSIGIEYKLSKLGITQNNVIDIVKDINLDRMKNNPVLLTKNQLVLLFNC